MPRAQSCGVLASGSGWLPGPAGPAGGSVADRDRLDDNVFDRLVVRTGADIGDPVDHLTAGTVGHLTEDRVLALQPGGRAHRDEELRAVGALAHALAGVGHGQHVGLGEVLVGADLVVEGVAGPAEALTQRAAALDHEAGDDPVEDEPVEERGGVAATGVVAVLLLALGEADEV